MIDNHNKPIFKRVLLKLSGETFLGKRKYGIDPEFTSSLAQQIKEVHDLGVDIAIVVGGGNIFRGAAGEKRGVDRATGDYMGMLATIINALALQDALEKTGVETRILSALEAHRVVEPFIRRRAMRHMEKERIVILAGGTGSPYVTTDTAATLRALELHCDVVLKATKVDGVYDKDPKKYPNAKRYSRLTFDEALNNPNIRVMDTTAIAMAKEYNKPIVVFNLLEKGNLKRVILGKNNATIVEQG